jgi:hypothetical protein
VASRIRTAGLPALKDFEAFDFTATLDPLLVDERGYLFFSRAGAELLFQVFAARYERRSLRLASNLPCGE